MHGTALEIGHQVDLVLNVEGGPQVPAGWMPGVLVHTIDFALLVVSSELGAQHFDIRIRWLVMVKGICRRMHSYKGLARFDPIQKGFLVWQRQIAGGVGENDAVEL